MTKRVITAIIALVISIPFIYKGGLPFYLFAIVISLLGLREILSLITNDSKIKLISYISLLTIIGSGISNTSFNNLIDSKVIGIILLLNAVMMLDSYKRKDFNIQKGFYILGVTLFLAVAFETIIITRNMSIYYFIYLFVIAFATDTFAHFTGSIFGKHKVSKISPNKTWEGCAGGLVFGSLIGVLFYLIFVNQDISLFMIILITMFFSIIGQLGDLFFSQVKRYHKIKDFSNLMPGHGGVLDRLDSAIFIFLAFTYIITCL